MSGNAPERRSLRRYLAAVDRRYSQIRGVPAALSPRDVPVVIGWFEASVPLTVVLRVLDELAATHGKSSTARQPIRSLAFARRAVAAAHRQHLLRIPERSTGHGGGFDGEVLRRGLEAAAAALGSPGCAPLGATGEEAAAAIRAQAASLVAMPVGMADVERVELALGPVDDDVDRALPGAFPELHAEACREAEALLGPHLGGLGEAAWRDAVCGRAVAILRDRLGLPRARLFFLSEAT